MRIAGIWLLRDEVDVVAVNLAHHRRLGVTDLYVVDNGSTDGTADVLRDLAADDPHLHLELDPGPFRQDVLCTRIARQAAAAGCDWMLSVDGDEFWWVDGGDLPSVLGAVPAEVGVLEASMVTFVQSRLVRERATAALRTMTRRPAAPVGTEEEAQALVESGAIGYVQMQYPVKCVSRLSEHVIVHLGAHAIEGVPGAQVPTGQVACLHAPLRAQEILAYKAVHGRRLDEAGLPPDIGWHVRRWARLEAEGGLDAEWAANSWRGENPSVLDLPGGPAPLVVDTRLVDALAPLLGPEGGTGLGARLRRRVARAMGGGR